MNMGKVRIGFGLLILDVVLAGVIFSFSSKIFSISPILICPIGAVPMILGLAGLFFIFTGWTEKTETSPQPNSK